MPPPPPLVANRRRDTARRQRAVKREVVKSKTITIKSNFIIGSYGIKSVLKRPRKLIQPHLFDTIMFQNYILKQKIQKEQPP